MEKPSKRRHDARDFGVESLLTALPRVIGKHAAELIFARYGGRERFAFPMGENNNPAGAAKFAELAALIGRENALKLGAELGGFLYYIPKGTENRRAIRDDNIRADFDNGATVNELVAKYDLSGRAVDRILNRWVEPSKTEKG